VAGSAQPVRSLENGRRYLLLFGLQTIGALIILRHALPLYQAVVADPAAHRASAAPLIWGLTAAALIQVGFWVRHWLRPPLPQFRNALLGYLILFLSRMSFLLATAIFGFVFITRRPEFHIPVSRYFLTLAGLFSFFLFTPKEVERLANSLIETEPARSDAK
jgi:hypothetical protein